MRLENQLLLARVRAPGDPHALVGVQGEEAAPQIDRAGRVDDGGVGLHVARDDDALGMGAERDDAPGVLVRLHREHAHVGEDGRQEASHEPVTTVGPVRDAPVGDHHRDAAGRQRAQRVGPELRLHADQERRIDRRRKAPDGPGKVEGEEAVGDEAGEPLPDDLRAGIRDRRHHNRKLGMKTPEPLDERCRGDRLADRDRVQPGRGPALTDRCPVPEAGSGVDRHSARQAPPESDGQPERREPDQRQRRVQSVHHAPTSRSAVAVTSSSLRSTSFRASSRSASRAIVVAAPNTAAARAKGAGTRNASHVAR